MGRAAAALTFYLCYNIAMLRFLIGPSGAGKSTLLRQEIIELSCASPDDNFLVIVPDQFTMQTQADMVKAHPDGAIMNIDILSFGRLTHRIFDTVGQPPFYDRILDDTGKSLILRKIALRHEKDLPLLGANMRKPGFIDEVKSVISEFMQYGVGAEGIDTLRNACAGRKMLAQKLTELKFLYEKFLEEISGAYLTTEERLDLLCDALPKSPLVRDAVIVFDGFTGFTPIQYRVIRQLLCLAREVIFTFTTDADAPCAEQDLFYLSHKTMTDIRRIAKECEVEEKPVTILNKRPVHRLADASMLAQMEAQLFRFRAQEEALQNKDAQIRIFTADNPGAEVREVCLRIYDLVRETGCSYRDIAIVAGDLNAYADQIERHAARFDIPIYLDRTNALRLNPFTEYLKSALRILSGGFQEEHIFHFLRTGFAGFTDEETDRLETYVRATGVRFLSGWQKPFVRRFSFTNKAGDDAEQQMTEDLAQMNVLRERFLQLIDPLLQLPKGNACTAARLTEALHTMIDMIGAKDKLTALSETFREQGDAIRAKEYEHILEKTLALLEQIGGISGDDPMTVREYTELLSVGFGDMETGTIPLSVDRVVAGDMERTRLKEVKHLFFVGVNDTAIPKEVSGAGLLSGFDRQFLLEAIPEVELAPTPRQQMYLQRLYLYMNLTKPSQTLTLSYATVGADGKSIRPAYLIHNLRTMFPSLTIEQTAGRSLAEQLRTKEDALTQLAGKLRALVAGTLQAEDEELIAAFCRLLQETDTEDVVTRLIDAAFYSYTEKPLPGALARELYGERLSCSVSRIERFAACCYAHFLQYGLKLKEAESYTWTVMDLGNVFHGVLEDFGKRLKTEGLDWIRFTEEDAERILDASVSSFAEAYGNGILFSGARAEAGIRRIRRILKRTVSALQYQLRKGQFTPAFLEFDFRRDFSEGLRLSGRIDRVDLAKEGDEIYVKVVDFKSGKRAFDATSLYYGLQLQLILYLNVVKAMQEERHPDSKVTPAAVMYYQVQDPVVREEDLPASRDATEARAKKLIPSGIINADENVLRLLDESFTEASDVIPVKRNKNGSLSAYSRVMEGEDLQLLSDYVDDVIVTAEKDIHAGKISVNPYCDKDGVMPCTYCDYASVCGKDRNIRGYTDRRLEALKQDEVLERIRKGERGL